MRVDPDALAEWSRTLDRLPLIADALHAVESTPASAGLPAVTALHQTNSDALRSFAAVAASLDCLVGELRAATETAAANYSLADDHVTTRSWG